MHRIVLSLALLATPAMAQDRYVFTLYRGGGAAPHFIGSFDNRAACDDSRSQALRDTQVALAGARQAHGQAGPTTASDAEARMRALQTERRNLLASVRGERRERLLQDRLTAIDRELEALRAATEEAKRVGAEVERLAAYEQALQESSICERR